MRDRSISSFLHKGVRASVRCLLAVSLSCGVAAFADPPQLPAPTDLPDGPANVTAPSHGLSAEMENAYGGTISTTTVIGAHNLDVLPGETLSAMGIGLNGVKLTIWADDRLWEGVEPIRTANDRFQAAIPAELNDATMLVWPIHSSNGIGEPIRVNGPELNWVWPCRVFTATPGKTIRLFGTGLCAADTDPVVYIAENVASPTAYPLTVTYKSRNEVRATLPSSPSLSAGTYNVYIHNGTGGEYGWSKAAQIEVEAALETPPTTKFYFSTYEEAHPTETDSEILTRVLNAIWSGGNGGIIKFDDREYTFTSNLVVNNIRHYPIVIEGTINTETNTRTILNFEDTGVLYGGIILRARGAVVKDLAIKTSGIPCIYSDERDHTIQNVVAEQTGESPYGAIWIRHSPANNTEPVKLNTQLLNCTIKSDLAGVRINTQAYFSQDFVLIDDCDFTMHYQVTSGSNTTGGNAINMEGCSTIIERCTFDGPDKYKGIEDETTVEDAALMNRAVLVNRSGSQNIAILNNTITNGGGINTDSRTSPLILAKNTGEQILFHKRYNFYKEGEVYYPYAHECIVSGVGIENGKTKLTLASSVEVNPHSSDSYGVLVTTGDGSGQWRAVDSLVDTNSDGFIDYVVLELPPLRIDPYADATLGDKVAVSLVNKGNLIKGNYINPFEGYSGSGIPTDYRTAGIFIYYDQFGSTIVDNIIKNVSQGVMIIASGVTLDEGNDKESDWDNFPPVSGNSGSSGWNTVRGNTITDLYVYEYHPTTYPSDISCFLGDLHPSWYIYQTQGVNVNDNVDRDIWIGGGNHFAGNICSNDYSKAVQLGWYTIGNPLLEDSNWLDTSYVPNIYKGIMLSVVENNRFDELHNVKAQIAPPMNWTLLRNNDYSFLNAKSLTVSQENDILGTLYNSSDLDNTGDYVDQYSDDVVSLKTVDQTESMSLTASLVSRWKFEESEPTTEPDSGYAYNSSLHGADAEIHETGSDGVEFEKDGSDSVLGNAVELNSSYSGYLEVPANVSHEMSKDFTIVAWIKPSSINSNGSPIVIKQDENNAIPLGLIVVPDNGGGGGYELKAMYNNTTFLPDGDSSISTSDWQQVALTVENMAGYDEYEVWQAPPKVNIKMYVDGVLLNTVSGDGDTYTGGEIDIENLPLLIGRMYYGTSYVHYDGLIDDVRIYNRVLTDDELKFMMTERDLIGYWSFNEPAKDKISTAGDHPDYVTNNMVDYDAGATGVEFGTVGSGIARTAGGELQFTYQDANTDDIVDVADGEQLINGLDAITISVWVNPANSSLNCGILGGEGSNSLALLYDWNGPQDEYHQDDLFLIHAELKTTGGLMVFKTQGREQVEDQWQHIVMSWSSESSLKLYLDGDLYTIPMHDSGSMSGTITNLTGLQFGRAPITSDTWLGLMDEVRIYDRELTADEIEFLYENTAPE